MSTDQRYDRIGHGYAELRREDPRIAARIRLALGGAKSVLNVGAGAGSYEPTDCLVVAVEPSQVMVSQRAASRTPVIRALAQALPLRDGCVDAAMSVLSIHHWAPHAEAGVREMRRVARGRVVIGTIDAEVSGEMWLMAEYLHEVAALDRRIFPPIDVIREWLGPHTEVVVVPVPADTTDWTLMSFWAHPERVLDAGARAATSGFARMTPEVVQRVVQAVRDDLRSGTWDERHAELRRAKELDVGLRLLVSRETRGSQDRH
ncbi:MAG: class I SAM-dependent methyltransferase [Deltaproteobacteria bacterium]|nr:class I SAM-dependent methyltransferase [Deltaproteobacteria bacterium]